MINLYSFVPVMKKTNKRMKTKKRLRTKLNNLLNVVYRFMFTSSPKNNKRVKFNYANFVTLLPICLKSYIISISKVCPLDYKQRVSWTINRVFIGLEQKSSVAKSRV